MAAPAGTAFRTSGLIQLTRPQLLWTMVGLMLSVLLASLDQTIVGTAEPRIIASLSGFTRYPWVATAYLLTATLAVPIFAKLSDMYGRKWFFLGGSAGFVATSALCGAAGALKFLPLDGMNQLIVFRGLQGIGAGMMMGLAFTIIGDVFSPAERGRYQGFFAATWGMASIFGPTLGGWLTDHVSWRACFYVNLPVGIVAILAMYLFFPTLRPQGVQRVLDWAGLFTLIAFFGPLLLALTWVTEYGWSSPRVESLLVVAAVMLAAFLFAETKAVEPLLPLSLFRNSVISMASVAVFVLGMGMFGVIYYFPLFMQGVLGVSATRSGNLLTPMMLGSVAGSMVSGQMNLRLARYKPAAVIGSITVAIGMILFALMDASTTPLAVLIAMIVTGVGMGLLMPVYTVAVQNSAPARHMGAATASTTFFRSIGSTMGVAVFGSVLLTNYHRDFAKGIPAGIPARDLAAFSNPLLLAQLRPQLEATFARYADGPTILRNLFANVRTALLHGLQLIFLVSAVIMCAAVVLNILLKDVKLRRSHAPEPEVPVA
ncbi:MAG: MFS transporter [Acidobacteriia bacterium]|nr:MFS transporter [Terriglobia bacterium]